MSQTNKARYKYNPDEMSENDFLSRFVVRCEIFDEIFEDLQEADYSVPNQHYILIGQRGQGKTTILRKLKLAIEKDKNLNKFLIPVKFAEEQYRIRELSRLWEEVAEYLQIYHEDIFIDIHDQIEMHFEDVNYHTKSFGYLDKALKKSKKKILLLIDNIDVIFKKLKPQEQHRLREILLTSSSFIIVGASTKMFEQQYDYSKPFYEFFKTIFLEGLNNKECISLLRVIGNEQQTKKIEKIIKQSPARIETLRRVTGGVPRTMVMLFDIFIQDNGNAFDDLMSVLDDVTPLYQERMNLPPALQDIVDALAMNWDGMLTKDISKKTRLKSKVVSAQLKQLEKYQIIDFESTGKNKIYFIKERFFNIWYLMRYGRKKDRDRVEWLIKFLLSWYDQHELEDKAKYFIKKLLNHNHNESYVYHFGEALSYAGLELKTEHSLKQSMRDYFNENKSSFAKEVSQSDVEILKNAIKLEENGQIEKAIELLIKSQKESSAILFKLALLLHIQKHYKKAESYYLKAIESGHTDALQAIGILYYEQMDYKKAESYYLKAIENGDTGVLINLAIFYEEQEDYKKAEGYYFKAIESGDKGALKILGNLYSEQKDYKKAESYYLKAIESGDTGALKNLGNLYNQQKDYKKAESYYLKAIESADTVAFINLAILYEEQEDYKMAESYYHKAIESGDTGALINLGILYKEQKDYRKAESYYLKAIESGHTEGLRNLGILYREQQDYQKAEDYYLKAIESGDSGALRHFGNLCLEKKEYQKAENYFLKAIDSGDTASLNSLAWLYFKQTIKMKRALKTIKQSYNINKSYYNTHTLAIITLWAEEFTDSYAYFKEWIHYENALDSKGDIITYINLLMAKGQYYKAKELFEIQEYQLKERYKPLWYALMTLLQDDFPHEIKKMGPELKQTVDEVLEDIDKAKQKYSL